MPVTIHCPNPDCRKACSVAEVQLGRASRCAHCGEKFTPGAASTAEDAQQPIVDGVAGAPLAASLKKLVKTWPDRSRNQSRAGIAAILVGLLLMCMALGAATQWDKLRPWFATDEELTNSIGMKLVLIPAGKFTMGSPSTDKDHEEDEVAHEVEITKPFYMGSHEVTIGQWRAFVKATSYQTEAEKDGVGGQGFNAATGNFEEPKPDCTWKNSGWAQTDAHPVVNVTWNDAVAFCAWLSTKEAKTYRLPTEAEWEYACRTEITTRYYGGENEKIRTTANVADASFKAKYAAATWAKPWDDGYPFTAPVGRFQANAFGLYDMHGNVWEWCQDWYGPYAPDAQRDPQGPQIGTFRVQRGGSWIASSCRAADRDRDNPTARVYDGGFRVVFSAR